MIAIVIQWKGQHVVFEVGHWRCGGLHLLFSWTTQPGGGQLPCCEGTQAVLLQRGPRGEKPRLPAALSTDSPAVQVGQLGGGSSDQSSLQMTAAPADTVTITPHEIRVPSTVHPQISD